MTIKARVLAAQRIALCVVRCWWRPVSCVGLATSVWVNLVVLPWRAGKPIEFAPAAAYVTAIVAAFAIREAGKIWGKSDDA